MSRFGPRDGARTFDLPPFELQRVVEVVDFDKLADGSSDSDPTDPVALYASLDKRQSHVALRPAQQQLLEEWAKRRGERDLVLKLTTGAGKTTVGLVALYSHMVETRRPCLFLCPTNQLVEQVIEEGRRCGIEAVSVSGREDIPPEVQAGTAILVASVQAIFNSKAGKYEREGFYAVVIDDAHAAVEIVRKQFRIAIPRGEALYSKLLGLFRESLRDQSRGSAEEIENGSTNTALEVPYWTWNAQLDTVTTLLAEAAKDDDTAFKESRSNPAIARDSLSGISLSWGMIKNCLNGCRCFFSGKGVEIAPEIPPVERIPTYENAKHRIFMSATISDESVLIREMACSEAAASNPIALPDAGGQGERMVLVPRLMTGSAATSISHEGLAQLCRKVSAKHAVVVLAPSNYAAKKWAAFGAEVISESAQVPKAVAALRSGASKFVVFANRYDGLDLPDDACRLLVLDGAPIAYSLMDMVDMACRGGGGVRRRTVMHRIEQGLGRAVRSPSDYAVVVVHGDELVSLISRVETREDLTEQTRRQIELGMKIALNVKLNADWESELEILMNQCLNRDQGWKRAYQASTKKAVAAKSSADKIEKIAQAVAERKAWLLHTSNQGDKAEATLRAFTHQKPLGEDVEAFLLQRMAWYVYKSEPERSVTIQTAARDRDHQLLMPPAGAKYRPSAAATKANSSKFIEWLEKFDHPNAAISEIEVHRARLTFAASASHELFEQALCDIGSLLGFESRRPDKESGEGPDVLWLDGQIAVPLEAKNRTSDDTEFISKHVAAQLMQAEAWTKKMHSDRKDVVPVSVHPKSKCGPHAILPERARVMTPECLSGILTSIQGAVGTLQLVGGTYSAESVARKLTEERLSLKAILARMAKPSS